MRRLIFDSCFWFALYNERDPYHSQAVEMAKNFESPAVKILVPFPSLYETLNTEFVDNKRQLRKMRDLMSNHEKVIFVYDDEYKDDAYLQTVLQEQTKASLVDNIILAMLADPTLSIDGVVTFNGRDFAEPCRILEKEMICYAID